MGPLCQVQVKLVFANDDNTKETWLIAIGRFWCLRFHHVFNHLFMIWIIYTSTVLFNHLFICHMYV